MRYGLLTCIVISTLLCLAGCPKPEAEGPGSQVPDTALNIPEAPGTASDALASGNTASTLPLAHSPFNLDGEQLGAAPSAVRPGLSATGLEFDEYWRDEDHTGMIISRPNESGPMGLQSARAYFENGELVCYSQVEKADLSIFDLQVEELTQQYGEPMPEQPPFVAESQFMQFFDEEQVSDLRCWADLETETAYLAGLSRDGERAMYMIMQPQRFDASQAGTLAASGS